MQNGAFNRCLNLDLSALELGFKLYLKDRSNAFFKVDRLSQKINYLLFTFLDKAKAELKSGLSLPSVKLLPAEHPSGPANFTIDVNQKKVVISTPFQFTKIKESSSSYGALERGETKLFLILISYFLIKRLHANLVGFYDVGSTSWEFSRPDSSDASIRKITERELRAVNRADLRHAMGSRRVIVPLQGYTRYRIATIGLWGENVLETARFVLENNGLMPPWETRHRICFIIDSFWGARTHNNVIISLLERGNLKSLEEIYAFLIEKVIRLYEKGKKSKEEIVEEVNLPFVEQEHPMLSLCFRDPGNPSFEREFLDEEGLVAKYESGMSNQEIFEDCARKRGILIRSDPHIYRWIGRYFWGSEGEVIIRRGLRKLLGINPDFRTYLREEKPFWDRLFSLFLESRESREEILKDLGLPSPLQIYRLVGKELVKSFSFWVELERYLEGKPIDKDYQTLFSMIEKSMVIK